MIRNRFLWIIFLLFTLSSIVYGQKIKISEERTQAGAIERIVFSDSSTGVSYAYSVVDNNPYRNLGFRKNQIKRTSGIEQEYDLKGLDTRQTIAKYFQRTTVTGEELAKTKLGVARTSIFINTEGELPVISYSLSFFDEAHGLVAVKSSLVVLDKEGKRISNVPESNQPQYEPVVTDDGKYIAFIEGDIVAEAIFTLVTGPVFRICDVQSGKEVFRLEQSDLYSILRPTQFDNLFKIVLHKNDNTYEYNIISPKERVIYRRDYSGAEIGNFKKITKDGILINNNIGGVELHSFSSHFTKLTF